MKPVKKIKIKLEDLFSCSNFETEEELIDYIPITDQIVDYNYLDKEIIIKFIDPND